MPSVTTESLKKRSTNYHSDGGQGPCVYHCAIGWRGSVCNRGSGRVPRRTGAVHSAVDGGAGGVEGEGGRPCHPCHNPCWDARGASPKKVFGKKLKGKYGVICGSKLFRGFYNTPPPPGNLSIENFGWTEPPDTFKYPRLTTSRGHPAPRGGDQCE